MTAERNLRSVEHKVAEVIQIVGAGPAGFGMRYAIHSGILAARSLMGGQPYDSAWRERLRPSIDSSIVNRAIYSAIGNRGYQLPLKSLAWSGNARRYAGWLYRPGRLTSPLPPWANRRHESQRKDNSCNHVDCSCIWCRCGGVA